MESSFLASFCEFISRKLFITTFGISTFFEIIFGIPSFVFIIAPFIVTSLIEGNAKLFMNALYLAAVFLFAISGLIAFILHLIGKSRQFRQRLGDDYWYKLKTYDNFNAMVIILLGFGSVIHAITGFDAFVPVAKSIYLAQMRGYQEHNPNCPDEESDLGSKLSTEIFLDELQQRHMCCGWESPSDWLNRLDKEPETRLPYSCCSATESCDDADICSISNKLHYVEGCKKAFVRTFRKFDPTSYSTGVFYFLVKAVAYLTYCNSYKEIIEAETLISSPQI